MSVIGQFFLNFGMDKEGTLNQKLSTGDKLGLTGKRYQITHTLVDKTRLTHTHIHTQVF